MVVIRLARVGRVKQAMYRIVAADKRRSATSKFLAVLGTYNPHTKQVKLEKEAIEEYLKNGAQPSDRVLRILQAEGVKTPEWAKIHNRFKQSKQTTEEIEGEEKPIETAGEVAAEASNRADEAKQSIDDPETAATEAEIAKEQKEATEKVTKAAEEAEKPQTK